MTEYYNREKKTEKLFEIEKKTKKKISNVLVYTYVIGMCIKSVKWKPWIFYVKQLFFNYIKKYKNKNKNRNSLELSINDRIITNDKQKCA